MCYLLLHPTTTVWDRILLLLSLCVFFNKTKQVSIKLPSGLSLVKIVFY